MKKDNFLKDNPPILQFSKLDQNNKAQFLSFLIKNNITFDNAIDKNNVIAKVTLKTLKSNLNTQTHNNNQTKKINKNIFNKSKDVQYLEKQNHQLFYHPKKQKQIKKLSLLNNNLTASNILTKRQKKSQKRIESPFKQVKINKKLTEIKNLPVESLNEQLLSLKNPVKSLKTFQQTKNCKIQQKTPQRRLYSELSLVKSGKKSDQNIVHKFRQSISPMKSQTIMHLRKQQKEQQNLKLISENNPNQKSKQQNRSNKIKNKSNIKILQKSSKQINHNSKEKKYSKPFIINNRQKSANLSQDNSHGFNTHGFNTQKNQNYELQERLQLIYKYKECFSNFISINPKKNISIIKQRPVCWPLNQVQKFLDEFYDYNFTLNTQQILNGSKKLNQSLSKGLEQKPPHIIEFLQKFLNKKFNKVQKAIQYNLINLLYSIAFNINQQKQQKQQQNNSSLINIKLFENFLTQKYILEDYLFFLFSRNILKKDFKKSFIFNINQNNNNIINQQDKYLNQSNNINKKQIDKFLKHIVGQNNQDLLQEYHHTIFFKIQNYSIDVHNFINILVEDYQLKRETAEESHRQKLKANQRLLREISGPKMNENQIQFCDQDSSLQDTFNKILNFGHRPDTKCVLFQNISSKIIRQDSLQELTFGEETKQMLREVDFQENIPNYIFWQSPYRGKTTKNIDKDRFLNDQFNQMIAEKLCQKTLQLIQLLSFNITNKYKNKKQPEKVIQQQSQNLNESLNQHSENKSLEIQQLLFSKALNLFFTVVEMNKVKWLKQLHIVTPSQDDIQKVQQIQLFFRKIRQNPTAKDIAQFCKLILTVSQITEQLSKFFV